jgi:hypothetical protein
MAFEPKKSKATSIINIISPPLTNDLFRVISQFFNFISPFVFDRCFSRSAKAQTAFDFCSHLTETFSRSAMLKQVWLCFRLIETFIFISRFSRSAMLKQVWLCFRLIETFRKYTNKFSTVNRKIKKLSCHQRIKNPGL